MGIRNAIRPGTVNDPCLERKPASLLMRHKGQNQLKVQLARRSLAELFHSSCCAGLRAVNKVSAQTLRCSDIGMTKYELHFDVTRSGRPKQRGCRVP
jgi:hypothetical protein